MVGRLKPETAEIKLVTVPTLKSRPYGMVTSSKSIPFFVEFGSNKIASIDPDTMAIREYVLPHDESRPRRVRLPATTSPGIPITFAVILDAMIRPQGRRANGLRPAAAIATLWHRSGE